MTMGLLILISIFFGFGLEENPIHVILEHKVMPPDQLSGWGWARYFRLFPSSALPDSIVPETAGETTRFGRISLGRLEDLTLLLARAPGAEEDFSALYLDLNGNNDFTDDGPPWQADPSRSDDRIIALFPGVEIAVSEAMLVRDIFFKSNYVEPPVPVPDRFSELVTPRFFFDGAFRFNAPLDGKAPVIGSFFGRDWMLGKVRIFNSPCVLYLFDADYNGFFTSEDRWTLLPVPGQTLPAPFEDHAGTLSRVAETRTLPNGSCWKILDLTPDGRRILLVRINAETARASERRILPPPPFWPEAERPIIWLDDFAEGITRANAEKKPLLLLLTAEDCPFSSTYIDQVLNDRNVVDLINAFIPVHLITEQSDETDLLQIGGFPYILIIDTRMNVLMRLPGYYQVPDLIGRLEKVLQAGLWREIPDPGR
ncbi:MAG: thioredoxin family protein [Planctomycetes bacterium]|nr:thioredoxin family protein [Planctomycetota bacterium]